LPAEVLLAIAKHCDNSFRDGAKLLEEAILANVKTEADVQKIIGLTGDHHLLLQLLDAKDLKKSIVFIEEYDTKGGNIATLIEALLDQLHLILLAKNGIQTEEVETYTFTISQIARLIKLFTNAYITLKSSPIESLPLQIAAVEYLEEKK
jgi:DNA polymerase-3 subunit gamma/tau